MVKRFNWDTWETFDEHRMDNKDSCEIVGETPPPSSANEEDIKIEIPQIKAAPRIETFIICNSFDNDLFIESGYLNVN